MENHKNLTTRPIPELIRMIAIPASVGFLFTTLFNVVDTYFAGVVSTDAVAALSLSFPVFFIIIAIASGISTGATALIANSLGANDINKARHYSSQAISLGLILSVFLTFLGLMVSPFLFRALGASDAYLALSLSYMNVIFYGTNFFLLNFILSSILTAQGNTKTYRNLLIIGFFLNIIFDPWFIRGGFGLPAMGLPGVAWATILIQFLTMLYLFFKIARTNIFCEKCLPMLKPNLHYYRDILAQGVPASLNMLTVAIGIFVITYFVSQFGRASVAAYGIVTRIDQLALLPMIGLSIASLTLVGQNNGAKLYSRIREIFKLCLSYAFYIIMASSILIFIFAGPLMNLFTQDQTVVNIGIKYLYITAPFYFSYAILFISVSTLQGLKRPSYAIWVGLYRQILAPLFFFWLLTQIFNWQIAGIWWGVVIVNWSAAIFTLFYLRQVLKKITA